MRQYLEDKVIEIDTLRDRHSEYFADFLAVREGVLRGDRQSSVLLEINAEIDNVCAMWQHAVKDDARLTLARLGVDYAAIAEAQPDNAAISEIVALIVDDRPWLPTTKTACRQEQAGRFSSC